MAVQHKTVDLYTLKAVSKPFYQICIAEWASDSKRYAKLQKFKTESLLIRIFEELYSSNYLNFVRTLFAKLHANILFSKYIMLDSVKINIASRQTGCTHGTLFWLQKSVHVLYTVWRKNSRIMCYQCVLGGCGLVNLIRNYQVSNWKKICCFFVDD